VNNGNKQLLLREFFAFCPDGLCNERFLTEQEKLDVKNGAMILTGVAQRSDAQNGNGRVYPHNILVREVENYKKAVREGRGVGELDHPDDTVINLNNASHKVIDIWWEGKDVMVKLKVLSGTPGQQLRSLVNDGVAIGLSSRGLGSVKEAAGTLMVEDDFQLICFDVVSEPSTKGAYIHLMEAKNPVKIQKSDRIFRALNEVFRK
jgi:hypothetical protein